MDTYTFSFANDTSENMAIQPNAISTRLKPAKSVDKQLIESSIDNPLTIEVISNLLNKKVKEFGNVWVIGEVSDWNPSKTKSQFTFFKLKQLKIDDDGQQSFEIDIACRNTSIAVIRESISNGVKLKVNGGLTFNAKKSSITLWGASFQVIDELGELRIKFEEIRKKIFEKGFRQVKLPIPSAVKTVALITGQGSQAEKDVFNTISNRNKFIKIIPYYALVQGEQAVKSLQDAITQIHNDHKNGKYYFDVIIIARGGGSFQDLWPFNEYDWLRFLNRSKIPTVSGVGHEGDVTLTDFVVDLRAATPTQAAMLVSSDIKELINRFYSIQARLHGAMDNILKRRGMNIAQLNSRLSQCSPLALCHRQQNALNMTSNRLTNLLTSYMTSISNKFNVLQNKLVSYPISRNVDEASSELNIISKKLNDLMKLELKNRQNSLLNAMSLLDANSPLNILSRGFTVTTTAQNELVSSANINVGDIIETETKDTHITSKVIEVKKGVFASSMTKKIDDK